MLGKSLRSVDRLNIPVEATMGRTLLFSEDVVKKYIPKTELMPSILQKVFGKQEPVLEYATPPQSKFSSRELMIINAMKMAKQGASNEEIFKKTGLPMGSVGTYAKRFGITRKKGRDPIVKNKAVAPRYDLIAKELNAN